MTSLSYLMIQKLTLISTLSKIPMEKLEAKLQLSTGQIGGININIQYYFFLILLLVILKF